MRHSPAVRAFLMLFVDAGLSVGTAAVVAGFLAPWWPALELINHFRPFLAGATALLLALALLLRSRRLIPSALVLFSITTALVLVPDWLFSAPRTPGADRSLRVITLNTWVEKGQADRIRDFIKEADPDLILLQEVGRMDRTALLGELASAYPFIVYGGGSPSGPALLSRRPWVEAGVIPNGRGRPLAVWARFDGAGQPFEALSVHTANPFEWEDQPQDIETLIGFVRSRAVPIIMGGDLNLTPFSWKLIKLAQLTGLHWVQTFAASWPASRFIPVVLLDHILISDRFRLIDAKTGPAIGSDHRPVVADLAFGRTIAGLESGGRGPN